MAIEMQAKDETVSSFAPGWAPAVLTDRGSAMCRLLEFEAAFKTLNVEDRAWFARELSELLIDACDAELATR